MATYTEFAQMIKSKYPEYTNVDDKTLAEKVISKYPEYSGKVTFDEPTTPKTTQPKVKSNTISPLEPFKQAMEVAKDVAKPIETYKKNITEPIQKFRSNVAKGVAEGITHPIDEAITTQTTPAKTATDLAEGTLKQILGTIMGKPKDVSATTKSLIGGAIESVPMTPEEIGSTMLPAGLLSKGAKVAKIAGNSEIRIAFKKPSGEIILGKTGETNHLQVLSRLEKEGIKTSDLVDGFASKDGKKFYEGEFPGQMKDGNYTPEATEKTALDLAVTPKPTNAQIVMDAIKEAKPIRKQQELMYSQERSERIKNFQSAGNELTGEARFKAKMSTLSGELRKVQYEGIQNKIGKTPEERQLVIDGMMEDIMGSPRLAGFETATAGNALKDALSGKIPTESGLSALEKVFGKDFTKTLLDKRTTFQMMKDAGYEIANIPRAMMASFDVSAPLRQGIFFISKPKQFLPAVRDMFKAFKNERAYDAINEQISKSPNIALMKDSKVALTEMNDLIGLREERFPSSWAQQMPGESFTSKFWNNTIGRGVRASGRAYAGFLNKLRADVFDDFVSKAQKLGLDPYQDPKLAKDIASLVNRGSGRGTLPEFMGDAKLVNSVLFSPKLVASRIQILNPWYYVSPNVSPFVRKEALKTLLASTSIVSSVVGLAVLGGAKTELNPISADFGKIKIGNTRIDLGGRFSQYIRLAAQLISGKMKSTTTGRVIKLGEKYGIPTRKDVAMRFIENKEAPVVSFATALLNGKNMVGEPFNVTTEIANRFIPMVIQDLRDIVEDDPKLLPLSVLGALGAGVQTYKPKPKKL